jgi:hypothetical protein
MLGQSSLCLVVVDRLSLRNAHANSLTTGVGLTLNRLASSATGFGLVTTKCSSAGKIVSST